jgi:hypothetical protein
MKSKIKFINCFGTSFTAGGGFEFDSFDGGRQRILNNLYSNVDYPNTQFNFSYPGQLNKLVKNIKVTNYAKNGYGEDRSFRQIYEILHGVNFNKDEHVFLIEGAGIGRREIWLNELNDYIVCNFWFNWDTHEFKNKIGLANSYGYDTEATEKIIEKYEPIILEYLKATLNLNKEIKKIHRNKEFFISFMNAHNLNYFYVNEIVDDRYFNFGDGVYFKQSTDFGIFSKINKLLICDETNGVHTDNHFGYTANKIIALTIHNRLVELNLIDSDKVDINWKELKDFKLKSKII